MDKAQDDRSDLGRVAQGACMNAHKSFQFGELSIITNPLYRERRENAIENFPILQSKDVQLLLRGKYNWHKHAKALLVLFSGGSAREAMRESGLAQRTAFLLAKRVRKIYPHIVCGCGQPPGHRGWCSYRVKRSPKRTEFLKRFGRRSS